MPLLDSLIEDPILSPQTGPREVFIKLGMDAPSGDGNQDSPFRVLTALQLNSAISDSAGNNVVIRLGPGLFRTSGAQAAPAENPKPLLVQSGMRIIGAGMFNTVLRLDAVQRTTTNFRDIPVIAQSAATVDDVEISDLTIDCNTGNQPPTPGLDYARMATTGISLYGRNIRVRRVRFINFGNRTPNHVNGTPQDSRASAAIRLPGIGCVIEDCVIEQPYESCARETDVIGINGGVIRNNFFDMDQVNPRNGFRTVVTAISSSGSPTSTVTVQTAFPHNVKNGDYIEFKGTANVDFADKRFKIITPATDDPLSRQLTFTMPTPSSLPSTSGLTVEQSFLQTGERHRF